MKRDEGMTLEFAREMAEALVELLAPACERIEIAGSIRRQKPDPNDVEIVAVPKWVYSEDYHETGARASELNLLCDQLLRQGVLEKRPDKRGRHCWGTGIKRAVFFQGEDYAPVDLFQVIAPRQWGVIYATRTGPGRFNRLLVTSQWLGGACPKDRKVAGGRVWNMGKLPPEQQRELAAMSAAKSAQLAEQGEIDVRLIPTPAEEDFFQQLCVPCWPPEERTEEYLQAYLPQTR